MIYIDKEIDNHDQVSTMYAVVRQPVIAIAYLVTENIFSSYVNMTF